MLRNSLFFDIPMIKSTPVGRTDSLCPVVAKAGTNAGQQYAPYHYNVQTPANRAIKHQEKSTGKPEKRD
jgi:hypothetical protein